MALMAWCSRHVITYPAPTECISLHDTSAIVPGEIAMVKPSLFRLTYQAMLEMRCVNGHRALLLVEELDALVSNGQYTFARQVGSSPIGG